MANWSSDTYYFGRATPAREWRHISVQQEIIRLLAFNAHEHPYIIGSIELVGPAVKFDGGGKWGCGCPIPNSVWDVLNAGIVEAEGSNGFDDDVYRAVTVGGQQVFLETLKIWDSKPFAKYMGINPEEKYFFKLLWDALDRNQEERFQREAFLLLPESEQKRLRAEVDAKYQRSSEEGWEHHRQWMAKQAQP